MRSSVNLPALCPHPFWVPWLFWPSTEKAMAPHSGTLAWKIPWTEEPGRLQSMGSLRVGHNWLNSLSLFPFIYWRRKRQPTPVFLPGESQGWGSLVGCRLWGRTESWLKRLSSSSSSSRLGVIEWWLYSSNALIKPITLTMQSSLSSLNLCFFIWIVIGCHLLISPLDY